MPLIVETGVGVTGANSYCAAGQASLFVDELGALTEWLDVVSANGEDGVLIGATRLIESRYGWLGTPLTPTQGLGLPRAPLTLEDGRVLGSVAQVALAAEAVAYLAIQLWRTRWTADGRIVVAEVLPDYEVRYAPAQRGDTFEAVDAILAPMTAARVPAGWCPAA